MLATAFPMLCADLYPDPLFRQPLHYRAANTMAWLVQHSTTCSAHSSSALNLAGYSPSMAAKHEQLVTVGGFSDRVLDWIGALELPEPVAAILGTWSEETRLKRAS